MVMNPIFHNKLQCYIQWISSNLLSHSIIYIYIYFFKKSVENANLKIHTQSSVTYKPTLKHNVLLGCSNMRVVWGNNFCVRIFITILRWLTISCKKVIISYCKSDCVQLTRPLHQVVVKIIKNGVVNMKTKSQHAMSIFQDSLSS